MEFELWLRDLVDRTDLPFEVDFLGERTARWLRGVFREHGPVEGDRVIELWHRRSGTLLLEKLPLVRADLRRTYRGSLPVEIREGASFRHDGRGAWFLLAQELEPVDPLDALTDLATAVQEELAERWEIWPVCRAHNVALRADVQDERAVWVCGPGNHLVSAVGELAPGDVRQTGGPRASDRFRGS